MGMIAEYLMVDESTLDRLMKVKGDELADTLFEIEESREFEFVDIEKIWDALHCFLTGVSASEPIEGDKLSESVVGVHVFDCDDFIACSETDELQEIITAMEAFDFEEKAKMFTPILFKQKDLYPNGIWLDGKEHLIEEMRQAFTQMLAFFKKAQETHHHVIISIL